MLLPMSFTKHVDGMQAKDEHGRPCLSGGEAFTAYLQGPEHVHVMVCSQTLHLQSRKWTVHQDLHAQPFAGASCPHYA